MYNIGNNIPVNLLHFIYAIEQELGVEAVKEYCDMQPCYVYVMYADVADLVKDFNYKHITPFQEGLWHFVKWYKLYYGVVTVTA